MIGDGNRAARPAPNKLRAMMTRVFRNARVPVFFIHQRNDYSLSPTRILSAAMKDSGKCSR
jgi:hypothetical protein